jgi:hypothetical protein
MSNTGGGRDGENREAPDVTAERSGETGASGESAEPVTDAAPAASPAERAEPTTDAAPAASSGGTSATGSPATTAPAAEPGPVGPGDTAVIPPAVAPSRQAPTTVEPSVGSARAGDGSPASETPTHGPAASTTAAVPESDDDLPPYVPGEPYPSARSGDASAPDPGAPVNEEPADAQSRLDAAVQRANAVPVASDRVTDETPDPVAADAVRRETYVPPAAGAAVAGAATVAGGPPHAPQTVYVQAPTPPKAKSNRGFGVLVALIGAAVFAALYAAVAYVLFLGQAGGDATELFLQFLTRPIFWVPVIATFIGFALLVLIVNRGAWWMYAVFGLLVGVLVYFSYIGAALLTVNAWELTQQQAVDFINSRWLDPLAIAAGVIAREVPIWLGGWIAKRGRGVAERNRLAMEAYDRELAAGPRPVAR